MDSPLLLDRLETLTEHDLITRVVIPLLASLGFENIESIHGPYDSGRDIVCSRIDALGRRRFTAILVKRFHPSAVVATRGSLTRVLDDLRHARHNAVRFRDGTEHPVDEIILVTPYRVTADVTDRFSEFVAAERATILDGDHLARLLQKHAPRLVHSLLGEQPPIETRTATPSKALIDFLASLQNDIARLIGSGDSIDPQLCFVIMSFSSNPVLADFYTKAIKPTIEQLGYRCERVDEQNFNGPITEQVFASIRSARFVVADLTEARPNCYYELGIAHTLSKTVIHPAYSLDANAIHFDVKDFNFIIYSRIGELAERLRERVLATIGKAGEATR